MKSVTKVSLAGGSFHISESSFLYLALDGGVARSVSRRRRTTRSRTRMVRREEMARRSWSWRLGEREELAWEEARGEELAGEEVRGEELGGEEESPHSCSQSAGMRGDTRLRNLGRGERRGH